jgi:acetylornithine deacetylase/succinyl-diaminopimelate desuccinylase-like protein
MSIDTIEWEAVKDEAVSILSRYVQVNTTNPPGNEMEAVQFLQRYFEEEGVGTTVYEPVAHRGNLLVTLKGQGLAPPLVLLNHMDVVPAEEDKWDLDPFGGIVKDDYVYGRGTLDMKGYAVAQLMAVLLLRRLEILLKRDVIFLAVADEETGGKWGTGWMLDHEPRLRDAAFVLNEGSSIILREDGSVERYEISTAQKVVCQFDVCAVGTPGHGSMPHGDSANVKLVHAVHRIADWQAPVEVLPMVREYFSNLATAKESKDAHFFADIEAGLKDPDFAQRFAEDPYHNAMVRNTVTPTMLRAGHKVNVIPSDARATFDCRVLPGTSCEGFLTQLRQLINDDDVQLLPLMEPPAHSPEPSPTDTDLYRAIREVAGQQDPGAVVTQVLMTGATDSRYFRQAGIPSYDFMPFRLQQHDMQLIHGHNERISVENLKRGVRSLFEIIHRAAAV